jgi:cell division protein FtsB
MLRNRDASRTTQLLEAVCEKLVRVEAQNQEMHAELRTANERNNDLKRRVEHLEGELAKRACWDPALHRERQSAIHTSSSRGTLN